MGDQRQTQPAAWHRRVGYALVHALLLLAVEWRLLSPAAVTRDSDWAIVAVAIASSAAFYYLQGSDPGFLTEGECEALGGQGCMQRGADAFFFPARSPSAFLCYLGARPW